MSGKWSAALALLGMFGLGIVSGITWQTYHAAQAGDISPAAARRVRMLNRELRLTPAQDIALRQILTNAHQKALQINEEVSWDLEDIHAESIDQLHKILTPEQNKKFDQIHRKSHIKHSTLVAPTAGSSDDANGVTS